MRAKQTGKLRPLWRCLIGVVAIFLLYASIEAYQMNRAIRVHYFNDFSWPHLSILDIVGIGFCIYLVFVALFGRWKFWKHS